MNKPFVAIKGRLETGFDFDIILSNTKDFACQLSFNRGEYSVILSNFDIAKIAGALQYISDQHKVEFGE